MLVEIVDNSVCVIPVVTASREDLISLCFTDPCFLTLDSNERLLRLCRKRTEKLYFIFTSVVQ